MERKDRLKLYFLLAWWLGLNVYVWAIKQMPLDRTRVAYSAGTLVIIVLLAWLWRRKYRISQERARKYGDHAHDPHHCDRCR